MTLNVLDIKNTILLLNFGVQFILYAKISPSQKKMF